MKATMRTRTIGEAAAAVGVATHVLRHWEDVGALAVSRNGNGYRVYDDRSVEQARTVRTLRQVGLSLAEIIAATSSEKSVAQRAVAQKLVELEYEVARRQQAITFLRHTVQCRHRYLDECADCADFVSGGHANGG